MPSLLIVDCLEVLLPVITKMVNSSLIHGHFQQDWKEALVKPLLKKTQLGVAFNNQRPISNLRFISKLTKHAAYNQIYDHVMANDLFPKFQSAYRQRYSTETALLKNTVSSLRSKCCVRHSGSLHTVEKNGNII